jgi:hypothetical protein
MTNISEDYENRRKMEIFACISKRKLVVPYLLNSSILPLSRG